MYNYAKLQWRIKEKYKTLCDFSGFLGITYPTLHRKLNGDSAFDQYEIEDICKLLGISRREIGEYFFTLKVEEKSIKRGEKLN